MIIINCFLHRTNAVLKGHRQILLKTLCHLKILSYVNMKISTKLKDIIFRLKFNTAEAGDEENRREIFRDPQTDTRAQYTG